MGFLTAEDVPDGSAGRICWLESKGDSEGPESAAVVTDRVACVSCVGPAIRSTRTGTTGNLRGVHDVVLRIRKHSGMSAGEKTTWKKTKNGELPSGRSYLSLKMSWRTQRVIVHFKCHKSLDQKGNPCSSIRHSEPGRKKIRVSFLCCFSCRLLRDRARSRVED